MTITAILGANYGDEGKGRITDLVASQSNRPVVVRHNGGAQAGHTVHVDGKRHIFSHMSAGSLAGATTYLSRFFVCNPELFWRELRELSTISAIPEILVDPQSPVTLPYDVMLNRWIEEQRGADRHGSCGVGFHETLVRCADHSIYATRYRDLKNRAFMREMLTMLRQEYYPERANQLGIEMTPARVSMLNDPSCAVQFLAHCGVMQQFTEPCNPAILRTYHQMKRDIIFEGAQGLLLDPEYGTAPHLTPSSCGLANVRTILEATDLKLDRAIYCTRPYLTRHGAGPLADEVSNPADIGLQVRDLTNLPNPWQGRFRIAPLDQTLCVRIMKDFGAYGAAISSTRSLPEIGLTCVDHVKGSLTFSDFDHKLKKSEWHEWFEHVLPFGIAFETSAADRQTLLEAA